MDLDFIASVIVPIIALPMLSLIGWFVRNSFIAIKRDIEKIIEKINTFQLTITKIDMNISSIEKDMEKANDQLEKTNSITQKNSDRITEHGHIISNIKTNVSMLSKEFEGLEKRILKLETSEKG